MNKNWLAIYNKDGSIALDGDWNTRALFDVTVGDNPSHFLNKKVFINRCKYGWPFD